MRLDLRRSVSCAAAACLCAACAAPSLLPSVSLRAIAVLHQRRPNGSPASGSDYVLLAQLSFSPVVRAPRRSVELALDPATWLDTPPACDDPLLCAWLGAAERATLAAWGVPP